MKVYVIYGGNWVEYVYATFELAYAHFNGYMLSHSEKIDAIHEFEVLTSIS